MSAGKSGELLARIGTGVIGVPLLLGVVYAGGWAFQAVLALGGAVMLWEYRRLVRAAGTAPNAVLLLGAGLGIGALVSVGRPAGAAGVLFGAVAVELALGLGEAPTVSLLGRGGALALGALYIGYPLGLVAQLRSASTWWMACGFILVWADDILAYAVGVSIGRHRLAPKISPKKSVEGAVGGLLGAVVAAVGIRAWLGLDLGQAVVTGLSVAAAGQIGDLIESALKREAGVKDSGRLLPGHGGLLDRFDSSLLAFPVLYWVLRVFR